MVPCGQFLDDFIDDFGFAVARIYLFSGYLFALKQRGNSVLAIIVAQERTSYLIYFYLITTAYFWTEIIKRSWKWSFNIGL